MNGGAVTDDPGCSAEPLMVATKTADEVETMPGPLCVRTEGKVAVLEGSAT